MRTPRQHRTLVVSATATLAVALSAIPAYAGYANHREFPHKPGTSRQVTAPGCLDEPTSHHCAQSNPQAVDMKYPVGTKIYAASPGIVVRSQYHSAVGNIVVVKEYDAPEGVTTYMTYEHLSARLVSVGEAVAPGELIAISGCTGSTCAGPHLHFQRATVQPTFGSQDRPRALRMGTIDGIAKLVDDDIPKDGAGPAYRSTNYGIGYASGDDRASSFHTFEAVYWASGGYRMLGRPFALARAWLPCWSQRDDSTAWRYVCTAGGHIGNVQMLYSDKASTARAIMKLKGSDAFLVTEPILFALTEPHNGADWVSTIGYPVAGTAWSGGATGVRHWYQRFQGGEIRYFPSLCRMEVWAGAAPSHAKTGNATSVYDVCSQDPMTGAGGPGSGS